MDDPGLVAEVARFCYLSTQMPAVLQCDEIIKEMIEDVQRHKDELVRLNKEFANEYRQCTEQLKKGHTHSCIERAVKALADGCIAGGRFYWPGAPDHLLHPCQYTFPQYRRERYLDSEVGREKLAAAIDPSGNVLARAAEQIARREQHKLAVQCRLCGEKGHFQKDCPDPHHRCSGMCTVHANHANLAIRKCGLRHGRGIRMSRKQRFLEEAGEARGSGPRDDDMDVV